MLRNYTELSKLKTFEERYKYLRLEGVVAEETFGYERYFNQKFYKSKEWKRLRDYVIMRDRGCDLGVEDREIIGEWIIIHHMNPVTLDDIKNATDILLDPEYLICTVHNTHNAIHYGTEDLLMLNTERKKNDTCPWRR